jgi:pimeloyl-ACP methyl ester carboxylesterase
VRCGCRRSVQIGDTLRRRSPERLATIWAPLTAVALARSTPVSTSAARAQRKASATVPGARIFYTDTVDDLLGLLDALKLNRVHLVATAGGGSVAFDFALSFPDRLRSLVVADSIGGLLPNQSSHMVEPARHGDAELGRALIRRETPRSSG